MTAREPCTAKTNKTTRTDRQVLAGALSGLGDALTDQQQRLGALKETIQELAEETRALDEKLERYSRALDRIDVRPLGRASRWLADHMTHYEGKDGGPLITAKAA